VREDERAARVGERVLAATGDLDGCADDGRAARRVDDRAGEGRGLSARRERARKQRADKRSAQRARAE
jgi:hypothetical protein